MFRRSLLFSFSLSLLAMLPLVGCGSKTKLWPEKAGPKVVVTFAPYQCLVLNVMGDKGTVQPLLSSQGPHHADMNITTRNLIEEADVLFYNGIGLDDRFATKLKEGSSNSKIHLVNLGERIPKTSLIEGGCCEEHGHEGHNHAHDEHDPHVWLSPKLAIILVEGIRDELKKIAPQFAEEYDANAKAYIAQLEKLHEDGRDLMREKKDKKIVTVHESLGYFAQNFKLSIAGVVQTSPGQEPNPTQLKELIDKCRKENVRIIAVEPQYSSRGTVEVLKNELTKAGIADPKIIELDTLETATAQELDKDWYIGKMRKNLAALDKVLK